MVETQLNTTCKGRGGDFFLFFFLQFSLIHLRGSWLKECGTLMTGSKSGSTVLWKTPSDHCWFTIAFSFKELCQQVWDRHLYAQLLPSTLGRRGESARLNEGIVGLNGRGEMRTSTGVFSFTPLFFCDGYLNERI